MGNRHMFPYGEGERIPVRMTSALYEAFDADYHITVSDTIRELLESFLYWYDRQESKPKLFYANAPTPPACWKRHNGQGLDYRLNATIHKRDKERLERIAKEYNVTPAQLYRYILLSRYLGSRELNRLLWPHEEPVISWYERNQNE